MKDSNKSVKKVIVNELIRSLDETGGIRYVLEPQSPFVMDNPDVLASYVYYYNRKYGRDEHLFKERFRSEPVNDMAYFTLLLRYIHQNPVKAGMVKRVGEYEYSSWGEFDWSVEPVFQICDTTTVLRRIPFEDLEAWVNEPPPDDVRCLEMEEGSKGRPSDDQVWLHIREWTGATNSSAFQQLEDSTKRMVLRELKEQGASHRQLERLTGVGRGLTQRV